MKIFNIFFSFKEKYSLSVDLCMKIQRDAKLKIGKLKWKKAYVFQMWSKSILSWTELFKINKLTLKITYEIIHYVLIDILSKFSFFTWIFSFFTFRAFSLSLFHYYIFVNYGFYNTWVLLFLWWLLMTNFFHSLIFGNQIFQNFRNKINILI